MDDQLKYRPNPNMLISKTEGAAEDRMEMVCPPKFAPTSIEENKKSRKERSNSLRKDLETLRRVRQSDYMMELMDDMSGKPEEIKETVGLENREVARYVATMEERDQREEELFTLAPCPGHACPGHVVHGRLPTSTPFYHAFILYFILLDGWCN